MRPPTRLGLLAAFALFLTDSSAVAQGPTYVSLTVPPCQCAAYRGSHYHVGGGPAMMNGSALGRGNPGGNGVSPNEQGLPRGRRYYGGRYFGSFNNRFYGPQYGYF